MQKKLMTNFSNKFKKLYFWHIFSIFGTKIFLKKKLWLCLAQDHIGLYHYAEFQKKLMSQSQENFQTEEWKGRRTDRPQFIGSLSPRPGGVQ